MQYHYIRTIKVALRSPVSSTQQLHQKLQVGSLRLCGESPVYIFSHMKSRKKDFEAVDGKYMK